MFSAIFEAIRDAYHELILDIKRGDALDVIGSGFSLATVVSSIFLPIIFLACSMVWPIMISGAGFIDGTGYTFVLGSLGLACGIIIWFTLLIVVPILSIIIHMFYHSVAKVDDMNMSIPKVLETYLDSVKARKDNIMRGD